MNVKTSILLMLVAGFLGCGSSGAGEAGGQDESVSETEQSLWIPGSDGDIQADNGPRIYHLYNGNRICWAYDPGELEAIQHSSTMNWDGFSRPGFAALSAGRSYDGSCGYPSGMYRRDGDAPVYKVQASTYCHVVDENQLGRFGGWGAVLLLKASQMDPHETYGEGPDHQPRTGKVYAGNCPG